MKNLDKPLFFDTSALLPYYRLEELSLVVQTLFTSAQNDIFINDLTNVEVASAIARWRRMNEMSETDASAIQQKFTEHKILGYYTYQPISCNDFKQATDWLLQRKKFLDWRRY